jgi:hypothetical protein
MSGTIIHVWVSLRSQNTGYALIAGLKVSLEILCGRIGGSEAGNGVQMTVMPMQLSMHCKRTSTLTAQAWFFMQAV